MRALSEARNPLLANEEQWEDDGIEEEPHGKATLKEMRCVLTCSDEWMNYESESNQVLWAESLGSSDQTNDLKTKTRLKTSPALESALSGF